MKKKYLQLNNINYSPRGFTLVEMVFYLAIASIMLLSISGLFGTISRLRLKQQIVMTVEEEGRQALNFILQDIRSSISIGYPTPGNTTSSLSLSLDSVTNIFDISSNQLRLTIGASAPISLTSGKLTVADLTFRNLTNTGTKDSLAVQFTLTYNNSTSRGEYSYNKTFYGSASRR